MTKERCIAVKTQLKSALQVLQSGACGKGRGVSLAITHVEDAVMRVDYHMRENAWVETPTPTQPVSTNLTKVAQAANGAAGVGNIVEPPGSIMPQTFTKIPVQPQKSTLAPAADIPILNTGIMSQPVTQSIPTPERTLEDRLDDISLLE